MTVRLRFAPAPTGYLHLGGARTALFNWLYARHLQRSGVDAEFVLRIEDTDRERSRPELIDVIFEVLEWLGLDWDGEPVYQSQRTQMYLDAVSDLLAGKHAYRCDCSQEAVKERNAKAGGPPGYDGFCADRSVPAAVPHVVRFRVPPSGATGWDDLVRGPISFENSNLEDFVLARSDGSPVFLVANAVDDADMGISHVIRGEDLINVTPKVLLLRDALGLGAAPAYAHVPLIVNEARKKLSKRRDDVSVGDYIARGFLPEAMVNYLALLGWGPPDGVEVRPIDEIIELFDVADIGQSPAMFDVRKLEAINAQKIRAMPAGRFVERVLAELADEPWADRIDPVVVAAMAPLVAERVSAFSEVGPYLDFLFVEVPIEADAWSSVIDGNEAAPVILDAALERFESVEWTAEALHAATSEIAVAAGLKLGRAQAPIRLAVTGRKVGPPLFDALALMDRHEVLRRVRAVRGRC